MAYRLPLSLTFIRLWFAYNYTTIVLVVADAFGVARHLQLRVDKRIPWGKRIAYVTLSFFYSDTRAAARCLGRIYLPFWGVDALLQGDYYV